MRLAAALLALVLFAAACTQQQATEPPPTAPATAISTAAPSATPIAATQPAATATLAPTPTATAALRSTATTGPDGAIAPSANVYDEVLGRVSTIRGLQPLEPIVPQFMSREMLAVVIAEDLEEDLEELLKVQEVLRLLELIPADADLTELLLELYAEQVVGFYDSEKEELFLIGEPQMELAVQEEITLAHEYVHALQQQAFDINAMLESVEDNSDAASALVALVEGDAVAVQYQYATEHIELDRLQEFVNGGEIESSAFDSTPYFLQQDLLFPYVEGPTLVLTLRARLAWEGVDDAYARPPASTEQVLHPQKYLAGEEPIIVELPDAAAALGEGWEEVYGNVMGEFFLRTYLETRLGQGTAGPVAQGWGGDRYALFGGPDGQYALVSLIVWDTTADASEFYDVMVESESVAADDFLGLDGERVLWIVSPSRRVTDALLTAWPKFW
ncbi:MAG: hypothetical protein OYI31_02090 [Chloroflexota bacterium]|nr:hypothetical protein [Chloroflexota bacterium]MDE2941618.1 hypothetical protein [Chloroflexota bacterium]MDE3267237.1 hypothetical protein [Chloroflexota bacterium]